LTDVLWIEESSRKVITIFTDFPEVCRKKDVTCKTGLPLKMTDEYQE